MEEISELDTEIKVAQLAAARLDVRIKEAELKEKSRFIKNALANPIVLGAVITAFVALNSALMNYLSSEQQTYIAVRKLEISAILKAIQTGDREQAANNLKFLVDAGLLTDPKEVNRIKLYLTSGDAGPSPPVTAAHSN